MNPEQSVIDAITELVDESLAKPWDRISGYDNDINQDECPHAGCDRDWHGLPEGWCPGSPIEGPMRGPNRVGDVGVIAGDSWMIGGRLHADAIDAFDTWVETVAPAVLRETVEAMRRFNATMAETQDSISRAFVSISRAAETMGSLGIWETDEADPAETPRQRALPRPSTSPPMWAQDASRSRRRRNV